MKEHDILDQIEVAHNLIYDIPETDIKKLNKKHSNIVLSNIGNSGLIEKVLRDIGSNIPIEGATYKRIPDLNTRSLVIIVSKSGTTKEIISLYKEARKKTERIVVITKAQALINHAQKNGHLTIQLPDDTEETESNHFFQTLFTTLFLLHRAELINTTKDNIKEMIVTVGSFSKNFQTHKYKESIIEKIPVIYTWDEFESLSHIIATYLNKHAKHYAIKSTIPEADYNEVEALANKKDNVLPVFLFPNGDKFEKARMTMNAFKHLAKHRETLTFKMQGHSKISQIIHTAMFFELVAERIAKKKGFEPYRTDTINKLKEILSDLLI